MDEGISQRASKGGNEDFAVRGGLEKAGEAAEEDAGVGSDASLGVGLSLGEVAEEVVVEDAVGELRRWSDGGCIRTLRETYFGSDEKNRLDGRFSDDRDDVAKSSELKTEASAANPFARRSKTHEMRPDALHHVLAGQLVGKLVETLQ